jgi:hypothetical protein
LPPRLVYLAASKVDLSVGHQKGYVERMLDDFYGDPQLVLARLIQAQRRAEAAQVRLAAQAARQGTAANRSDVPRKLSDVIRMAACLVTHRRSTPELLGQRGRGQAQSGSSA